MADLDYGLAVGADYAVHHAVGVERGGDVALAVEGDDAAFAFLRDEFFDDDVVGGLLERDVEIADAGADVRGDGVAHVEFADAGAGDGATVVIGVGAGADDGESPTRPGIL